MNYTFEARKKYFNEIEDFLKKNLKQSRFRHTLGVANAAACLAMRYKEDVDKAYIAGLFHDCAKCFDDSKTIKLCKKYNVELNEFEKENLFIVHGKLGAAIAAKEFAIDDEELLNGIRFHTTGRPEMTLFEKIIYLADFIEINRDSASDLIPVRNLVFVNIDAALFRVLSDMIPYLKSKGTPIDDMTRQTYEFYDKILDEDVKKLALSEPDVVI